jgi:hypothetical protein
MEATKHTWNMERKLALRCDLTLCLDKRSLCRPCALSNMVPSPTCPVPPPRKPHRHLGTSSSPQTPSWPGLEPEGAHSAQVSTWGHRAWSRQLGTPLGIPESQVLGTV